MCDRYSPVFASSVFSLGLHLALALALLRMPDLPLPAGTGLNIELIRSVAAPGQGQAAPGEADSAVNSRQQPAAATQAAPASTAAVDASVDEFVPAAAGTSSKTETRQLDSPVAAGDQQSHGAVPGTASSASDRQVSRMLELLHDEISDHKRYPYLARRQGREGIARVEFVLHPDGRIDNTALLESSRNRTLDRAALTAIEQVAPFRPAAQYLSQAQTFRIDVVFRLR